MHIPWKFCVFKYRLGLPTVRQGMKWGEVTSLPSCLASCCLQAWDKLLSSQACSLTPLPPNPTPYLSSLHDG